MNITNFPIALGCMGLTGTWNPSDMTAAHEKRAIDAFEAAFNAGITLYDHADIYGGGTCEEVFAACLAAVPNSREKIQIATKGGIGGGRYNLSHEYLNECIERSLRRMKIEYIDIYQVHRPDPFTHPRETARALNEAVQSGKVRQIGVSNYYPEQVRALQTYLDVPIVSQQIAISLDRLAPIYEGWDTGQNSVGDGTLDQCMALDMVPLAYSPLGGGRLAQEREHGLSDSQKAVRLVLIELSEKLNHTPTQIALSWLMSHPSGIIPLVGSANPEHIREAAKAADLRLSREDWYSLWTAAWNRNVP